MVFKATAATTGGRLSLMERSLPPGGRMPPAHRHPGHAEFYYVLDGEVTFILEGRTSCGGQGTAVLVPEGRSHTFGNTSERTARLLVLHAPALDPYFAELEALWSGEPPTPEQERELMSRHGMEPA
jgi:quercetin dioxygenase-like cupin family protein